MRLLLSFIIGYLIGTVNPAALLAKRKQYNLKQSGTGNLGATNTMLAFGLRYGIFVLAFDLCKAYLSVHLSRFLFPKSELSGLVAGVGSVVGHIYPWHLKFKGGKGSAWYEMPVVTFMMRPVSKSTVTSSPALILSAASGHSRMGSPMFRALR